MLVDVQVATPHPKKSGPQSRSDGREQGCENRPVPRIACVSKSPTAMDVRNTSAFVESPPCLATMVANAPPLPVGSRGNEESEG